MKFAKNNFKIAIDGVSSSGKSTLAKDIAKELNILYVDSGAMYRAVTLYAIKNNLLHKNDLLKHIDNIHIDFEFDNSGNIITYLNNQNVEYEIRSLEVSSKVSYVSSIPEVRKKMVELQRKLSENKSVVMDGRDIGTVVFPDADIKFFITADIETRSARRFNELKLKGLNPDYEEIKKNLIERDYLDQTRSDSPLLKANDAIIIDNTNLTRNEQLKLAIAYIKNKLC